MVNRWFFGFYWGVREESIEECADRLLRFFQRLTTRSPLLSSWHETGWSREEALRLKVDTSDRTALLALLDEGRNRTDFGNEVIEDLGFHVRLWNGLDDERSVGLDIQCGMYCEGVGFNHVFLELPVQLGDLAYTESMVPLGVDVIECWEPEYGFVASEEAMDQRGFYGAQTFAPFLDWILYLAGLEASPEEVPEGVRVHSVPRKGCILVLAERAQATGTPEHLHRVKQVKEFLSQRGYETTG